MAHMRESPDYKSLKKKALSRGWRDKQAEDWVKGWKEGWMQGQIEQGQEMLSLYIARDFPRAKVVRKIAQLRDATTLIDICVAINFKEISNLDALRKRLDEAIKAQNK